MKERDDVHEPRYRSHRIIRFYPIYCNPLFIVCCGNTEARCGVQGGWTG